jgi:hypothetical protein
MNPSPVPRSALRGHARGRDLVRAVDRNALPALFCIFKRAAQKTADSDTKSRRRRGEVQTSLRSANATAITPRHRHANASALPHWFLGIVTLACRLVALVHQHRRAGA